MCFGGGKSSNTAPPAPNSPTTFDYSAAQRSQMAADGAVSQAQAARQLSTTSGPSTFGAELGGNPAMK